MFDRLGPAGLFAVLVFVGGLVAAVWQRSIIAGVVAVAAAIFVVTQFFRRGDA